MPSRARQSFLEGFGALVDLGGEPLVMAATMQAEFLRRGLVVAAYNLLETFVLERSVELVVQCNTGHAQFKDLPDHQQAKILKRTLAVAHRRVSRSDMDHRSLLDVTNELSTVFDRSRPGLGMHAFAFLWEGSNMSADDLHASLRMWHVRSPFQEMRTVAGRLGMVVTDALGNAIDFRQDLSDLAKLRHRSAHDSATRVTGLELRAIPLRLMRIACSFDLLASVGAHLLLRNPVAFMASDDSVDAVLLDLRLVEERSVGFALLRKSGLSAEKRDPDPEKLISLALSRHSDPCAVIVRDLQRDISRWVTSCGG